MVVLFVSDGWPLNESRVLVRLCYCLQEKVVHAEELVGIEGKGTRLLQISRSTPLVTAAIIGHKQVGMARTASFIPITGCCGKSRLL